MTLTYCVITLPPKQLKR